jgi:dolichyl-phosphate-mannose-protein mannosyltransferase
MESRLFFSFFSGVIFDYMTRNLPAWLKQTVIGVTLGILSYSFILFSPLAYGMTDPGTSNDANSTMHKLKWLESWEF